MAEQPLITHYTDKIAFQPGQFNPVGLATSSLVKVLLVCFEAGQAIPAHTPAVDMTMIVLEGEGRLTAGDREQDIGPGWIGFVPAGQRRGVKAATRMVALHVVSPPPSERDHSEVVAQLRHSEQPS